MLTGGQCEIGGTVSCSGPSAMAQAQEACADDGARLTGFQGTCPGMVQYCCDRDGPPSPLPLPYGPGPYWPHHRRHCSARGIAACGFDGPDAAAERACESYGLNVRHSSYTCPTEYCCGWSAPGSQCANNINRHDCRDQPGCRWSRLTGCTPR